MWHGKVVGFDITIDGERWCSKTEAYVPKYEAANIFQLLPDTLKLYKEKANIKRQEAQQSTQHQRNISTTMNKVSKIFRNLK